MDLMSVMMMTLKPKEEPREQDLLSRLGKTNVDNGGIDCYIKPDHPIETGIQSSISFHPSPSQVDDNGSKFRPWKNRLIDFMGVSPSLAPSGQRAKLDERNSGDGSKNRKHCAECKKMEIPKWRKGPQGQILCNACGLRRKRQEKKALGITIHKRLKKPKF